MASSKISLAFGLTVLTMAFAIGHISGCHLNPAVTLGLVAAGRFSKTEAGPYIGEQVVGAIGGACLLFLIASGARTSASTNGLAANGYGNASPAGKYGLVSGFVTELVMAFLFSDHHSRRHFGPRSRPLLRRSPSASG